MADEEVMDVTEEQPSEAGHLSKLSEECKTMMLLVDEVDHLEKRIYHLKTDSIGE